MHHRGERRVYIYAYRVGIGYITEVYNALYVAGDLAQRISSLCAQGGTPYWRRVIKAGVEGTVYVFKVKRNFSAGHYRRRTEWHYTGRCSAIRHRGINRSGTFQNVAGICAAPILVT